MNRSYQIVEPESLSFLYRGLFSTRTIVAILDYLSREINAFLIEEKIRAEIDIIMVSYVSNYPAFGVYYFDQETREIKDVEDIEELVCTITDRILENKSLAEFISYINDNHNQIKEKVNQIL